MISPNLPDLTGELAHEYGDVLHFHQSTAWSEAAPPSVRPRFPSEELYDTGLALPPMQRVSQVSLLDALQMRFSAQGFSAVSLGLDQLSQVLGTALSRQEGHPYPSAGGLYVTRCYVVAHRVAALPQGVFEYLPRHHLLRPLPLEHFPDFQLARMLGQGAALIPGQGQSGAPVHLILTVDLPPVLERYGARGYRFALQESGHMAQNLVLAAAAHGLSSVTLGSFLDDRATEVLMLPPTEVPLYVLPLGVSQGPLHGGDPDRTLALSVAAHDASRARWAQWRLYTPHPRALLSRLAPDLAALRQSGEVLGSWYLVKSDAAGLHVRLRLQPSLPELFGSVNAAAEQLIAACQREELLSHWAPGHYEPEEFLFGGPNGMDLVHTLFSLDTQLCVLAAGEPQARADLISHFWTELLLRHSGLDAFERFDVWSRVGLLRPTPDDRFQAQLDQMYEAALTLKLLPTPELTRRLRALLPGHAPLTDQLAQWGQDFQTASTDGQMSRGPRQILAVCLIFHWNRMLYGAGEQMFLTQLRLKVNQPH